jgi:hypothetical protein
VPSRPQQIGLVVLVVVLAIYTAWRLVSAPGALTPSP